MKKSPPVLIKRYVVVKLFYVYIRLDVSFF